MIFALVADVLLSSCMNDAVKIEWKNIDDWKNQTHLGRHEVTGYYEFF